MAVPPKNGFYQMTNPKIKNGKIGRCIILNYENFPVEKILNKDNVVVEVVDKTRTGTKCDVDALKATFEKLKFDVKIYDNLNLAQTNNILNVQAAFNHSQYNCFALCILSHGNKKCFGCSDNKPVYFKDVYTRFEGDKCSSLSGKPKLFFIETCQGGQIDSGHKIAQTDDDKTIITLQPDPTIVPNKADFFKFICSYSGYFSIRVKEEGTWFIQELCKVLNEDAGKEELYTMVTKVTQGVADNVAELIINPVPPSTEEERYTMKQVPQLKSSLRWRVKFF